MKIGFAGLGLMGKPMAENILKKGFDLSVFNRTASKTKSLEKIGAIVSSSPAELAQSCDVVITMVTGPKDVQEIIFGKEGLLKGSKKGLIIIDMSTIGPKAARKIAEDLNPHGIEFIDAPVTGSVVRAVSGELTIFVGGKKRIYEKVKPILETMGKDIFYMGDVGSGQAIKLVNNLLVGVSLTALSEGMLLAQAQGLTRKDVMEALSDVPAVAPFMKLKMPNMVKNSYPTAFSISNMSKDLDLAVKEVKSSKVKLPLLETTDKLYKKAKENNWGDLDNSAVLKVLEDNG
jgi:3-hydroxyisobutyrate dehydrogenase